MYIIVAVFKIFVLVFIHENGDSMRTPHVMFKLRFGISIGLGVLSADICQCFWRWSRSINGHVSLVQDYMADG